MKQLVQKEKAVMALLFFIVLFSISAFKNSRESDVRSTDRKGIDSVQLKVIAANKRKEESKAAFVDAYKVFIHPRCMNCHPSGDAPLQGDDSHLHMQGVKRGPDGHGLYAMKCANCHQVKNWHLPSPERKMVFEGKTPAELAKHFQDNKYTGFKDWQKDLLHHVEFDSLVLNSFTHGTQPPLNHEQFVVKVKEWIEKGAVIPDR
jgi:hypothetical protein